MQQQLPRRILPPGVEDDIVFGIMWIRVGALKTIRPSTLAHRVKIQFWGESAPTNLTTSQTNPQTQEYEVRCPITIFEEYLNDMKNNLKIEVQNLGWVSLDLSSHLKKNITLNTKTPFEHFKGFFEVKGKNHKKVASLELEMCANFNPEIAIRQYADEMQQQAPKTEERPATVQRRPSEPDSSCSSCPTEGQKPQENRQSEASKASNDRQLNPATAVDVMSIENPALLEDFYEDVKQRSPSPQKHVMPSSHDNRIANSLQTETNTAAFNPNRYLQQPNPVTPKGPSQNFPAFQKVLTYSNLKLHKEETEKPSPQPAPRQPQTPINNLAEVPSQPKLVPPVASQPTINIRKEVSPSPISRKSQQKEQAPAVKIQSVIELQQQPQPKKEVLIGDMSDVKKVDESVDVEDRREILSRVVNLQEEIEKEKHSPKRPSPLKERIEKVPKIQSNKGTHQRPFLPSPLPQPHFSATAPQKVMPQRRKPSPLLLTMIVEIQTNSLKFENNLNYQIRYRPYGQKDSVTAGPVLPSQFKIVFGVGEAQVARMNKVPFIVEFWGAPSHQFMGVIKLSLQKIYKGFILDGRMNQLAVKTNLMPTVIYNGTHPVVSLSGMRVSSCKMEAYIGTPSQIQAYLNKPQSQKAQVHQDKKPELPRPVKPSPEKEILEKQKQQIKQRKKGTINDLTALLQSIDKASKAKQVQELFKFMKLGNATQKQFLDLLQTLDFKSDNPYHLLCETTYMKCEELSHCFDNYQKVQELVSKDLNHALKKLSSQDKTALIEKVGSVSTFGLVEAVSLNVILPQSMSILKQSIGKAIDTDELLEWLKRQGKAPLKSIKLQDTLLKLTIRRLFFEQCKDVKQSLAQLIKETNGQAEISVFKAKGYFSGTDGKTFSLWTWNFLKSFAFESQNKLQDGEKFINTTRLHNWIVKQLSDLQRLKEEEQVQREQVQQSKQKNQEQENEAMDVEPIKPSQIDDPQPPQRQLSRSDQKERPPSPIRPNLSKTEEQLHQQSRQQSKLQTIFEHKFIIDVQQLNLQDPPDGLCILSYQFPFEEEPINAKRLQLNPAKHRYKVQCSSTHKLSIPDNIQDYLGESTVSFRVSLDSKDYYGDLHSEDLVYEGSSLKVVPLFSSSEQGISGNIKIRVSYIKTQTKDALGRQTIRDVFLPKQGYLNVEMRTELDPIRLKQQLSIKEDFYLQAVIDVFGQDHALAPHYPPFVSKLSSDFAPLVVNGCIKLTLGPRLIEHLRTGNCLATLRAVYYVKERGTYQKKQAAVGSFKMPLLSVIHNNGLTGNYAFKNKLGMFVALANCSIKYQSKPLQALEQTQSLSTHSYWVLLDFTEVINFEGNLGWVRFEIVDHGRRMSTERRMINQGVIQLDKNCLLLQLGEQDFTMAKIISITMHTPTQRFGIDLNMRPVAKVLQRQNHFVDSHYFLTVDSNSRPRKIRVGLKVYAFKGPSLLGSFVEELARTPIRADQDQPDQDYSSAVESLRKHLKLSAKTIEDAVGLLINRRKKESLPAHFFSSKIASHLQVTPIIAPSQGDLSIMAQQLPSEVEEVVLRDYLQEVGLRLINLRPEILHRYTFGKLNENRLDQNVEYLGFKGEIDLLTLLAKTKIEESSPQVQPSQHDTHTEMIRVSVIRGYHFHLLYNGIPPNARVRIPALQLQTQLIERSSDPIFNEHLGLQIRKGAIKKLAVEVYHEVGEDTEPVLIGQGIVSIDPLAKTQNNFSKLYKAVIHSTMSQQAQATLDIKVQMQPSPDIDRDISDFDSSIGDSRIEEVMSRVKDATSNKKRKQQLFESSDED